MRAYSIASPNYDEELEFLSIKVADGPLTSRLQNIQVGDELFVSSKPTGTLVADHLLDGRNLYLISTGTGLAPFISIIQDPEVYEKFDRIILTHGVRYTSELAYQEFITNQLPNNPFFGEEVREKLVYYPTVTREEFSTQGRLTNLMSSGKMFADIGLDKADPEHDRFMICGSPSMLKDTCDILDDWGFEESLRGIKGHYVVERAFVE
jgi:ferredoxin--NADP+ reductase